MQADRNNQACQQLQYEVPEVNKSCRLIVSGVMVASAAVVQAEEWAIVGPRAMGMGGAGVAATRGGLSTYWNPAALTPPHAPRLPTFWDVEVPVSASAYASNDALGKIDRIVDLVDDLDLDNLDTILDDPGSNLSSEQLQNSLKLLAEELPGLNQSGTGIVTQASAGVMARIWQIGISAMGFAHAGGLTRVDLSNLSLGDEGLTGAIGAGNDRSGSLSSAAQAFADQLAAGGVATQDQAEEIVFQAEQAGVNVESSRVQANIQSILQSTQDNIGGDPDSFFTNNTTGADLRGILLQEFAISFAQPLFDVLSIGVNAKLINGWTYFKPYTLRDLDNAKDLADDLFDEENRQESIQFGIDAGVLFQPVSWISAGVVGRNLNNPEFEFDGPGNYEIERQFRAGVGVTPLGVTGSFLQLTLAADVDLVRNESEALPGYKSQFLGGGLELGFADSLFLRCGASKNLAEAEEDVLLHAGLGFRLWMVQLDIAGSLTPDFTEISTSSGGGSNDVPERGGFSLQFSLNLPLD